MRWQQGDFPFYFVQLANWRPRKDEPGDSAWAELREAQLFTLGASPNTGMAVTIDIGDAKDIHPRNKQDVGLRRRRGLFEALLVDQDIAHHSAQAQVEVVRQLLLARWTRVLRNPGKTPDRIEIDVAIPFGIDRQRGAPGEQRQDNNR